MDLKYDFSGYATKNDLRCADGRTIRRNAFRDCDGMTVPLVWQHQHNEPTNVLGHALLENRDDGVYTYGVFNDTEAGRNAKELVRHGDIRALSIYANQLVQKGHDVLHGMIREVSLVMAGANPGAMIEDLSFEHYDDDGDEFDAIIHNGDNLELAHSDRDEDEDEEDDDGENNDDSDETIGDIFESLTDKQKKAVYYLLGEALKNGKNPDIKHSDDGGGTDMNDNMTVSDVLESMSDEQKNVLYYLLGEAINSTRDEVEEEVAHNIFENDTYENSLSHAEMMEIQHTVLNDAPSFGSLRQAVEYHENNGVLMHAADEYGIENSVGDQGYFVNDPDFLFPDARSLNNPPEWIKRDMDWVTVVLGDTHHTPFSRVKSVFANITEADARAKGYIKGHEKTDEVFTLLKRTTTPQTIYKRQKVDRDDMLDITDFDTVAWIKSEMRMMLNEEIARAILIGDGRNISSDDKIQEAHVRPIVSDASLFTIQATVNSGATEDVTAKNMIKAAVRARKDYKGSGNPTLFTTEDWLTNMLLIEDGIGHPLYKSESELATAMRVSKIVTVPVMENFTLANGNVLTGIIVNLKDYNVGADKGGEINMFDDFDIDYNQQKYLIETRISGALIKPYSAIVLSIPAADGENEDDGDNG